MIVLSIFAWLYFKSSIARTPATKKEMAEIISQNSIKAQDIKKLRHSSFVTYYLAVLKTYFPECNLDSFPVCVYRASSYKSYMHMTYFSRVDFSPFTKCFLKQTLKSGETLYFPSPELYFYLRSYVFSVPQLAVLAAEMLGSDFYFERKGALTTKAALLAFAKRFGGKQRKKMEEALSLAPEKTESPMERALYAFLVFPKKYGGCGFPAPETNASLPLSGNAARLYPEAAKLRPDLLYRNKKIVLEYDSNEFHGSQERKMQDKNREIALNDMGYKVFPVTDKMLGNSKRRLSLFFTIAKHLGVKLDYIDGWEWKHRELANFCLNEKRHF